nr:reverse transcriptase domain-containing protein [Tanacetum cinerariifolium]
MISYLTRKISFTTLYYTLPPNNALSGLKQIKNDYDTNVMYNIARVADKIQLFVSHHQIDLSTMLIPNDGSLEEAFADLGASINLMPLSVWEGFSLPELTPTSSPAIVEPLRIELPFLEDQFQEDPLEDPPEVPMADNRTMAGFLQAPTEGYEDAIVIPEIAANNFELKHGLINLVQNKQFFEHDKEGPLVAKVSTSSSTPAMVRVLLLDKKNKSSALAPSPTPAQLKHGVAYQGPTILTPSKVVKQGTEVTKDQVQTLSSQSTAPVQPPVVQSETQTLVSEPVVAPVSALMPNLKPSIPYPSRCDNERRRDQANEQIEKFYEIFKDMSFEISFTDALILMPKFSSTLKALIGNKEKLSEMTRTLMNKHCSAVILNKFPRKLRGPNKFLIPCEFPGIDECLALADLGASINLMPLFVWEGLSLPELTPTCMTLELMDHSVSKPIVIAKDVSVKVGVFHFPADFMVVDFKPDLQVPLILKRCFLKTGRALIDSGNPTPYDDPIISTTSPTLTPFRDSDFLLFEEADAFLGLEDDPNLPKFNPFYYDPEGDILLLEAILNSKPLPSLPNHEQYMPSFKKELKVCEAKTVKSSVDEPHEVELKDLALHLENAFLEGENKLPVIISKELGDKEKSALIKTKCFKGVKTPMYVLTGRRVILWPIHYASKTMTDAESNYTATKKEMLAVVCAFEKFRSYLIMNKSIVHTDHFALKYLFAKKDAKARFLRWVLLLQEFNFKVLDTKGAENLVADHLSRLENPYENVLDPKEINETFPLETLSMVTFRGDSSAPWFADFANYHAGNFIVKVSFGPPSIRMPTSLSKTVTRANDKEKFTTPVPVFTREQIYSRGRDYLSKWVETKALPTNDARIICKFLKYLFARFGAPRAIISDRGTHFCNEQFAKVILKYGVTHRLSTTYHPQTSGQVEDCLDCEVFHTLSFVLHSQELHILSFILGIPIS